MPTSFILHIWCFRMTLFTWKLKEKTTIVWRKNQNSVDCFAIWKIPFITYPFFFFFLNLSIPLWLSGESIHLQCGRPGFDPWVGKIPWRRERLPTPVFLPGKSHGQRSLVGLQSIELQELDMAQWSCLENPRDQGSLVGCLLWGCRVKHDWAPELNWTDMILWTSVRSSSGTLFTRSSPLDQFVTSTENSYGI